MKIEKDRETTEKRLLTAVGEIVEESGLESLGINAVKIICRRVTGPEPLYFFCQCS